ncbi:MAG TPA: hypothetical protein VHO06_12315 [Polyangia bacterium]|nr:hypothetical protein [Polyangia bacterium]
MRAVRSGNKERRTAARGRARTFAVLLALAALAGCGTARGRTACDPDAGGASCPIGTQCLWLRSAGYFCLTPCAGGTCPSGQLCSRGVASSCMTCTNVLDICE